MVSVAEEPEPQGQRGPLGLSFRTELVEARADSDAVVAMLSDLPAYLTSFPPIERSWERQMIIAHVFDWHRTRWYALI